MKASMIFKTVMVIILVTVLSTNSYANGNPTSAAVAVKEEISDLSSDFNVLSKTNTIVSVFDQEGIMIYSDNVSKDDLDGRSYDFSTIDNGVYTFVTETIQKTVEKTFMVENNELQVVKEETTYHPVFLMDGDMLTVSYLNLNEKDISISLQDESVVYFEEDGGKDIAFGKMLNVKNLSKGEYSIVLTAGLNTYTYYFN